MFYVGSYNKHPRDNSQSISFQMLKLIATHLKKNLRNLTVFRCTDTEWDFMIMKKSFVVAFLLSKPLWVMFHATVAVSLTWTKWTAICR